MNLNMIISGNIFQKANFEPEKDKLAFTFPMYGPVFKIDIRFKIKDIPSDWANIFRITGTDNAYGQTGDRYPWLGVHPKDGILVALSTNDPSSLTHQKEFEKNQWYVFSIEQRKFSNKWKYQILFNGKHTLKNLDHSQKPLEIKNAKLYLSDKFYDAAKVEVNYSH